MIDTIKPGDKAQLQYLKERYHYLFTEKCKMEAQAAALMAANKDLQPVNALYNAVLTEMLTVDDKRTQLATARRHRVKQTIS